MRRASPRKTGCWALSTLLALTFKSWAMATLESLTRVTVAYPRRDASRTPQARDCSSTSCWLCTLNRRATTCSTRLLVDAWGMGLGNSISGHVGLPPPHL